MSFNQWLHCRWAWLFNSMVWWCAVTVAADPSRVKLAAKARLDLMANPEVAELREIKLARGSGIASRMNWVAAADQPRSLTMELDVSPLGWRPFEVQFTPAHSGEVSLQLVGVWEKGANDQALQQEVLWDALQCDGAELVNGSFEVAENDVLSGWQGKPSFLVEATERVPSVDGNRYVKTWHNAALSTGLKVIAGRTVTLKGFSRAAFPDGYREMPRGTTLDTPAHRAAARFLRGVNFGNYLEVPPEQDWAIRHSAEDLQQVAREGFDHVRIPIGWHHYTGSSPNFRLSDRIFRQVDPLVAEARRLGLAVLLNIHHFDEFTSHPDRERQRFVAIWRQIAEHFAAEPETLAFELLNEPKDAATTSALNEIYAEAIRAIRLTNPRRTIFVGPGEWNSAEELIELRMPEDDWNLIATVHCYEPMYFTHQGTTWTGRDFANSGIQFPGPPTTPIQLASNGRQSLQ
jgi:endoglucanase